MTESGITYNSGQTQLHEEMSRRELAEDSKTKLIMDRLRDAAKERPAAEIQLTLRVHPEPDDG